MMWQRNNSTDRNQAWLQASSAN